MEKGSTKEKMKESKRNKLFNFRLFSVILLSLILVISFLLQVLKTKFSILLFLIIALVLFVFVIIFNNFKKIKRFGIIVTALMLTVFVSANVLYKSSVIDNYIDLSDKEIFVSGRVCADYKETSTGNILISIDDLQIIGSNKNVKINGVLNVYTSPVNFDLTKIKAGRLITFISNLNFYDYGDLDSIKYLSTNCIGYTYVNSDKITILETSNYKFDEKVRNFIYEKLKQCDMKHADIAFSILFGKTYALDKNIKDVFTGAGVSHFLAVSGLHISLILAIFNYIFSKLKIREKNRFITMFVVLAVYMYLCDFSVSVVRASMMNLILLFSKLRHRHYDRLSSMSLTALVILIINPLKLYNYSFILSFSTSLIIILLYNLFNNILSKVFYDKFSRSVAVCLCINFGLSFVQLYLFKSFNLLSFLANLLTIPLVTIAFVFLLCVFPVVLIVKPFSIILKIFDFLFDIIISLSNIFNKLNLIITANYLPFILMLLWIIVLFIISEYFFTSKKVKLTTFISFSVTFLVTYCLLL